MEKLKAHLTRAFWFALALFFLFESWLWDHVKDWLRAFGRLVGAERFEPWLARVVARLSPPMTLGLFVIPAAAIFPFKLLALGLIAKGHVVTGVVAIFLAKTLALGVSSFLFDICREKLMQMAGFAQFYSVVLNIRAWATDLVAPYKTRVHAFAVAVKQRFAALAAADGGGIWRRVARLRELARQKNSA